MAAAAACVAIAVVAGVLLMVPRPHPQLVVTPVAVAPPVAPTTAPPQIPVTTASEAQIAEHDAAEPTAFRFLDNPRILVIDYPTLRAQGLALNRVAALVEKAEQPRDRVLNDPDLEAAVTRSGETIESYYYGHDYSTTDLARFFALADQDGVALGPQERFLRRLLSQLGMLRPDARGALISVPRVTPNTVDAYTRRIILRHELSHGEFFSNPDYAAYVRRAWDEILNEEQRAAFLRFLTGMNYDPANHDLIVNEMQAFLMFTPDARYISAAKLGMTEEALTDLRRRFLAGMPDGWLRRLATEPLP